MSVFNALRNACLNARRYANMKKVMLITAEIETKSLKDENTRN